MFQKYYDTNLVTTFIKNLVSKTYLPNIPIWKPDTRIAKNQIYLTKNYIVKAIKSYTPESLGGGPRTDLDGNYFEILDTYVQNSINHGYCSRYSSNTNYYDSRTHYYLGQYLRMQRDMYDIDLMAFYNCWCGEYDNKLKIQYVLDREGKKVYSVTEYRNIVGDGTKTLIIPIKYNQEYTIYANTNAPIELMPVLISNGRLLSHCLDASSKNMYARIESCNFKHPYVFNAIEKRSISNYSSINDTEKYLKLVLQVSENIKSPIIILEGDYSDCNLFTYGEFGNNVNAVGFKNNITKCIYDGNTIITDNGTEFNYIDYPKLIDSYCKTSSFLINKITDTTYAFDDRLVEYLLLNPITSNDEISDNIKKLQQKIGNLTFQSDNRIKTLIKGKHTQLQNLKFDLSNCLSGHWNNYLRMYLYDLTVQHWKIPKTIGITGFVDKDVENIIGDL